MLEAPIASECGSVRKYASLLRSTPVCSSLAFCARGACVAAAVLTIVPAIAAAERHADLRKGAPPNAESHVKGAREAKEPRESDAGFGFSALLAPTYSSNVYREQRRREADFDQNAPGERYYEMEGPADVGTELGVQGSYRWRLDGTRDARVLLGASYVFYVRNGIANYFSALGSVGYELGSRDRLSLRADVVPRRFKKNYSIREVDGNKFYEHAYYWQIEASPSPRLVGAVEFQATTTDGSVHSEIVRAEEPITEDLPGDVAAAAGRLLGRLATDCLSRVTR